ncbi:MAG TPA: phytanoyl-CoA dioxygenase family protein [Steroidobacteraceae bacterium]|nr:phytanoyl-CoA dioxygenase family protein [Steroidobacteraceae bacterium]
MISRAEWFRRPDGSAISDLLGSTTERDWRTLITPEARQRYVQDGVLHVPQLIHPEWLALMEQGMKRNIDNPGYNHVRMHQGLPGEYIMDHDNYHVNPEYQYLLKYSPIADIMQFMLDTKNIWLFHDQIFVKRGGNNKRTFWHQDLPYWIIDGTQVGSMWITLDPIAREQSLEFVPGSHRSTMYGGSTFNPADPTEPSYPSLPRIPDIDADRSRWNIVSWPITPGDVLILHPGVLHGGGGTGAEQQRRTITLRFFGDDVVLDGRFEREGSVPSPHYPGLTLRLKPGEPVRDPRFPLLRPIEGK